MWLSCCSIRFPPRAVSDIKSSHVECLKFGTELYDYCLMDKYKRDGLKQK